MSAQQPVTPATPVPRPSAAIGVVIGCLPVAAAVVAAFGIAQCRIGPMSYGYCSSAEQGTALTMGAVALAGWVLELLAAIVCVMFHRVRLIGVGLFVMSVLFPPLAIMALYAASFFIIGHH